MSSQRKNGLSFWSFVNANSKHLQNLTPGEEYKKAEKNKNIKKQHFTKANYNIINHVYNTFKKNSSNRKANKRKYEQKSCSFTDFPS